MSSTSKWPWPGCSISRGSAPFAMSGCCWKALAALALDWLSNLRRFDLDSRSMPLRRLSSALFTSLFFGKPVSAACVFPFNRTILVAVGALCSPGPGEVTSPPFVEASLATPSSSDKTSEHSSNYGSSSKSKNKASSGSSVTFKLGVFELGATTVEL